MLAVLILRQADFSLPCIMTCSVRNLALFGLRFSARPFNSNL